MTRDFIPIPDTMQPSYIQSIRSQVGPRKIFVVYATVILHTRDGQILLQERTDLDIWGLPGGVLELGEDILQCARRELREESGLEAGELSLVGVYSDPQWDVHYPNGDLVQQFTICLAGQQQGGVPRVDGIETRRQAFYTPEALPWELLPPWYKAMLRDYLGGRMPAFSAPYSGNSRASQVDILRNSLGLAPVILAGAVGVVIHPDGRLLMIKRRDSQQWTFPGGYCDLGENAAHTAVREIHEETGMQAVPTRLLGVYTPPQIYTYPNGDQVQPASAIFCMRPTGERLWPGDPETLDAAWKNPAEVLALAAHPLVAPLHTAVVQYLQQGWFILT